ncbi:hypothetical protein WJX72_011495 [[Myrmecia] bisecta]|uniref:Uncharacterized protein n=1 Tax=[Myrmecia] bisecta TaxID=41462 RepID=A0AAW1QSY8_9CHLO
MCEKGRTKLALQATMVVLLGLQVVGGQRGLGSANVAISSRGPAPAPAPAPVPACTTAVVNDVAKQEGITASRLITICRTGFVPETVEDLVICDLAVTSGAIGDMGSADMLLQACSTGLSSFKDKNAGCGCPIYLAVLAPGPANSQLIDAQLNGSLQFPTACEQQQISSLYDLSANDITHTDANTEGLDDSIDPAAIPLIDANTAGISASADSANKNG